MASCIPKQFWNEFFPFFIFNTAAPSSFSGIRQICAPSNKKERASKHSPVRHYVAAWGRHRRPGPIPAFWRATQRMLPHHALTSTFSYLSSPFRLSPFLFLCIIHCVGPSRHSFVITILVIHHVGPKATFRRNSMPNSFDTPTAAVARRSASASLVNPRNYQ